jgi:hypothetical protein
MLIADEETRFQTALARKQDMRHCHFEGDVATPIWPDLSLIRERNKPATLYLADGNGDVLLQIVAGHPGTVLHREKITGCAGAWRSEKYSGIF